MLRNSLNKHTVNWKTEKVHSPLDGAEMLEILLRRLALDADMELEKMAPPDYPFTTDSDAVKIVIEGRFLSTSMWMTMDIFEALHL